MTPPIVGIIALAVGIAFGPLGGAIVLGLTWDRHDRQQRREADGRAAL